MARLKKYVLKFLCLLCAVPIYAQKKDIVDYVNPKIGGVGLILEPTRPLVHLPNSMLRVHPFKVDELDDQLSGFPLTVITHRVGTAFNILPMSPEENSLPEKWAIHSQKFHPYYMEITKEKTYDKISLVPNAKSAVFKIENGNKSKEFKLRFQNVNPKGIITSNDDHSVQGEEDFQGMKVYFYGKLNGKIKSKNSKKTGDSDQLIIQINGDTEQLEFRYGISYISVAQAKNNLALESEKPSFETIKANAKKIWNSKLSKVLVNGWDENKKTVFYTSLYRTYERMVDINEYGKYYSAYDHQIHESKEPFYVDNWVWDSYIAHHPLNMILEPEKDQAMIRSYIEMYKQTGWMPSFAVTFGDWPAMVGNHASAWMLDAYNKGLTNFDIKTAFEGLSKNSLEATLLPWRNGPRSELDDFYNAHGYMPGLAPNEPETVERVDPNWEKRQAVSVTLENSFSDWCIAQLANHIKLPKEAEVFMKRSQYFRNVFRQDKGMVWPKDKNGNWIEPYDPSLAGREYFTENNAYTYNWHVKHDLNGLFQMMGGKDAAEQKLDDLFRTPLGLPKWKFWAIQPDASGLVGQYVMGNEPSFHIPYLYNYLNSPWKTQKRVRMLMDTWFTNSLFGIPGDDDGGGMSAFVVFSMMGFFQVTPGIPEYSLSSPLFNDIAIELANGKTFRILAKNNSDENIYVISAKLNGKLLDRPFFTHDDLLQGGTLELEMSDKPKL
ncbi:glycoside hydrolase family 92 protein [Sphingobacterium sp. HJSM2_6]|uniref:glycoside hydrolase family 92 protein n=1 Tax=Sphingobacterium sp. HJSM2_6 TaxID=3366264 RepID=UPI003BBAABBD